MTGDLKETTISRDELVREVVERKKAEIEMQNAKEHAETANEAKSKFLANVSHEIRTPLNAIIGYSEIILKSDNLEKIHEQASSILSISQNFNNLLNSLLDNSKIESGNLILEKQPFDLSNVLDYIVDMARIETQKKGIEFRISVAEDVPYYYNGDAEQLRHVLLNLVGNAIKFTTEGYVGLNVELVEMKHTVAVLQFSVKDTGVGIPADKQQAVFDAYSQAAQSKAGKFGGTGLGTTIAKNLVKLMGGEIGFNSREGRGSLFWCTVPLEILPETLDANGSGNRDDLLEQKVESPVSGRLSARILLVDDYLPNREISVIYLQEMGCDVDVAGNGIEAVAALQNNDYDLVIMDLLMPDMDGYTATKKIRDSEAGRNADVPIIALTSDATEEAWKNSIAAGMNDVCTKPINRASFQAAVDRWVEFSSQRKSGLEKDTRQQQKAQDTGSVSKTEPLDYNRSLQEFKKDRPLHNKIVRDFIAAVSGQIGIMRDALACGDYETIRKEAHNIIGGASTLAAMPLAGEAKRLEQLSRQKDAEALSLALDSVEVEFNKLKLFFQEVIHEDTDR